MQLKLFKRSKERKNEVKRLRRDGFIPAVLYSKGEEGETISVKTDEFKALMRRVEKGRLPTTVFTLEDEAGKQRRAIIKDIQYNVVNYDVISLDFEELHDDRPVNVKVPIECVGVAECVGVKLGGVLRLVIRHARVRCLPKDIPSVFTIDVADMQNRESRRLSKIQWPETVRPLVDLNEVAVVIAKK